MGAEIHYLTKQQYLPLLEANPHIDRIFAIQENVSEVLPDLRREQYDYVVDLHRNLRTLQVRLGLFCRVKWFSFNKLNFEKWLLTALKINRLPKVHIVDRYLAAAAPLGIENDGLGLDYFVPDKDIVLEEDIPATHKEGYIAIVIGASLATKKMPLHLLEKLCLAIDYPVILLGAKEEAAEGDVLEALDRQKIYNA